MKKLVLMVLFMTALGLPGIAQSGIYSGSVSVSQIAKHDLRKTGWIIGPEIGLGYLDNYFDRQVMQINANVGYQFTPHIYVGAGLGSVFGSEKHYHYNAGTYGRDFALSIYTDFRWYWFNGRSSPFLELNTGLFASFDGVHKPGWLITPALGWDIKGFDIKVSIPCILFEEKEWDWGWNRTWGFGMCLTIGYNFMINKSIKNEEN